MNRVNEKSPAEDHNVNQVREIIETEMNMRAAHVDETVVGIVIDSEMKNVESAVESEIKTETDGVRQTIETDPKMLNALTKIVMKIVAAVQLIGIKIVQLQELIAHGTTIIDANTIEDLNQQAKVQHPIATVPILTRDIISVPIIRNQRKNTRKSHRKNTTTPTMIVTFKRKQRKANEEDLGQGTGDELTFFYLKKQFSSLFQ